MKILLTRIFLQILLFFSLVPSAIGASISFQPNNDKTMASYNNDPHSFSQPQNVVIKHLDLNIRVDFSRKIIEGTATYQIENKNNSLEIILDSHDLQINKVMLDGATPTDFSLGDQKPHLGQPLRIAIKPNTHSITIDYKTSPQAQALLWLDPEQTAGKVQPFLFTQSEAIFARTWVPIQDSPGIRITYEATVQVPPALLALMSAENPQQKNAEGLYHFSMKQPIPPYLLALAVGDLEFQAIGARTGVYAEPAIVDKAAYEFVDMENMLTSAEELYGPYAWGRYDVLVLPPSFPFGGMENPRLTFATPTILTGDRSLVSLIAHELAHSWSGNLVTNATWNDFWLNEGFTVYFERRIMEALEGKDYSEMLEELGYYDLLKAVEEIKPEFTQLKMNLSGYDPDEGLNRIPYEKGYFLLRFIEEQVGREKWDRFLKDYFHTFAFQSMTTEHFIEQLKEQLIEDPKTMQIVEKWVYEPGMPDNIVMQGSRRFKQVKDTLKQWENGASASQLNFKHWSSHEWEYFIIHLSEKINLEQLAELDKTFTFTQSGNIEILTAWFKHVIKHKYNPGYEALAHFLKTVGRRYHVLQLYKELAKTEEGKKWAREIYKEARPTYHAVTRLSVDKVLID